MIKTVAFWPVRRRVVATMLFGSAPNAACPTCPYAAAPTPATWQTPHAQLAPCLPSREIAARQPYCRRRRPKRFSTGYSPARPVPAKGSEVDFWVITAQTPYADDLVDEKSIPSQTAWPSAVPSDHFRTADRAQHCGRSPPTPPLFEAARRIGTTAREQGLANG